MTVKGPRWLETRGFVLVQLCVWAAEPHGGRTVEPRQERGFLKKVVRVSSHRLSDDVAVLRMMLVSEHHLSSSPAQKA